MRVFRWFRMGGVAAFFAVAAPAMAQSCVGFTDVMQADAFCPNVEWIKNRQVTLGCTSTTLYCPSQPVTRLQMAAFLNRVGTALTPIDLGTAAYTTPGPGAENLSASPILCQTADYAVTGYPRRAQFNSKVNVYNPTADVELVIDVMYSTSAGAPGSWVSVAGSQVFQTLRAGGVVKDDVSMYPIGFVNLNVGSTYRFGVRVARVAPGGGAGDPFVYCENRVQIANRNGATTPFDEPERTGRAAQLRGQ